MNPLIAIIAGEEGEMCALNNWRIAEEWKFREGKTFPEVARGKFRFSSGLSINSWKLPRVSSSLKNCSFFASPFDFHVKVKGPPI